MSSAGISSVETLVRELDDADFREFWWGSDLLERCSQHRDARIVEGLCIRHYGLQNKGADSCHLLRETIKRVDGPQFDALWSLFQNTPHQAIERESAFILCEIGGRPVLERIVGVMKDGENRGIYLVMCEHLASRYADIDSQGAPTMTSIDVKTGVATTMEFSGEGAMADIHDRQMLRRSQENELFTPIPSSVRNDLLTTLSSVAESSFSRSASKESVIALRARIPTLDSSAAG